jgi:flagellar assembly protein FliH
MPTSSETAASGQRSAAPAWIAALSHSRNFEVRPPFIHALGEAERVEAEAPAAKLHAEASAEAYAAGEAAGRAAALAESEKSNEAHGRLRLSFERFDEAARSALAGELSATVIALCEQVLGDLAIEPDALAARCDRAAARIGEGTAGWTLRLNPEDIAMLGAKFDPPCRIQADQELERGALRLEGSDGAIHDGPAEWRAAIAEAIGK